MEFNGLKSRPLLDPAKVVDYGREFDLLFIHSGFDKGESFLTNEVFGDLVMDVSTKGKVRGIEVLNASDFFKGFGIDSAVLQNLEGAELGADVRKDTIEIDVVFKVKDKRVLPARMSLPIDRLDEFWSRF